MIVKRLKAALLGRKMWLNLKNEYDVDDGVFVLLMPEDDQELNEQALKHIDDLIKYRKAKSVVVLTDKQWIIEKATSYSKNISAVKEVSYKEIDNLISLYELYGFTERLLIVSLTKPHGSKLKNTINIHGVTNEDIVCLCIFRIRDWSKAGVING
jgi:hypothetical protein